jgi:hypothetical protein
MKAARQRIVTAFLLTASLCAGLCGSAGAGQIKYTYLKIGEGGGASVYAFKSKQACETARRKFATDWARMIRQMKKNVGNRGNFADAPRAKCLDRLPMGFVRRG